jgi:hypothetical protein
VMASVWKHGLPCVAQRALVSAIPMVVTEAPTLPYRWTATSTLKVLTVGRCVMRDERLYGSSQSNGHSQRPELGVEVSTEVQFQTPGAGSPRSEQRGALHVAEQMR